MAERLQIERFEYVQHLESGNPLTVGRQFPNVVSAIARCNRLHPGARVIFKISEGEQPTNLVGNGDNLRSNRPAVKRIAAPGGDETIRSRQVRIAKAIAGSRRMATR